jgi:hypothetical protein
MVSSKYRKKDFRNGFIFISKPVYIYCIKEHIIRIWEFLKENTETEICRFEINWTGTHSSAKQIIKYK